MTELFKKIYDTVICYESEVIETCRKNDAETVKLMRRFKEHMTETEWDELKDIVYGISADARREGFMLGARYAVKSILALVSDNTSK